jgi:hypothetical protein
MTSLQILDIALKILTLLGVIFAVYLYFKKPQEDSQIKDVGFEKDLCSLEKMVVNLRDNHLHTLESKLDKHISENQMVAIETTRSLTRMETLMEQLLKK